ncbi:MAG: sodium:solute symporter family protein [Planctomycetaceae bacterium]|nr:sodium:solute symporter family protein [Planctomycetaceae bacterium]
MLGIGYADWAAIAFYLVIVTVAGLWAGRQVKGMRDFVMPRTFGKLFMMMHSFGTATHSDQAVTVASKCYMSGLSGIWYQLQWLFATPFFWLIAPMMRRFRAITMANVFELRYNRSVAYLFVVVGLLKFTVNLGLMLWGTSAVIDACSGGQLPARQLVLVMTLLFVSYGLVGGLRAAIVTDFIQGILVIVFSFILLIPLLDALGGWTNVQDTVVALKESPDFLSLANPNITIFYIVMISLNAFLGVVVQPQNLGVCAAGKTEIEGAVGFMCGTMLKRFCTVAWAMTAMAAVALYGTRGTIIENPDEIYGMVAREFLPSLMPGLLGICMASLLAPVMGSCDSFMVSASGLVAENLYRPLFPDESPQQYLRVARISGLIVVASGLAFAYWLGDEDRGVVGGLEVLWKIGAMMSVAFWMGVFWRGSTSAGAWAATLTAFLIWYVTSQPWGATLLAGIPFFHDWGIVTEKTVDGFTVTAVVLPWQMVFYLVGSLLAGIIASLMTQPSGAAKDQQDDRLDRFYSLLRTPVEAGEKPPGPCELPPDVTPGPRNVFLPQTRLEIPIPGRRAIVGFSAGWACVIALLAGIYLFIAR